MKDPNRRRLRLGTASFNDHGGSCDAAGLGEEPSRKGKPSTPSAAPTTTTLLHLGRRWSFWRTLSLILFCGAASLVTFSAFQLFGVSFRPMVVPTWQKPTVLHAVSTASDISAATLAAQGTGEPDATAFDPLLPSTFTSSSSSTHHQHRNHRHGLHVRHVVQFPDQLVLIVNRPPQTSASSAPLPTTTTTTTTASATTTTITTTSTTPEGPAGLRCLYFAPDVVGSGAAGAAASPRYSVPPLAADPVSPRHLAVRCPLPVPGHHVSLGIDGSGVRFSPPINQRPHRWDSLAYASLLDREDNSTIVFVKGLNLRPEKITDAARYECVFGWQFQKPRYLLTSEAVSVAQEVVRCRTPLAVLHRSLAAASADAPAPADGKKNVDAASDNSVLVSVNVKGRGGFVLPSVATPIPVEYPPAEPVQRRRSHVMCSCTMVRNQARFLKEWVIYHARFGVQRFFIYDNNSNDSLPETVQSLETAGYNVSRHPWPWIKTQEAGFAHCALHARTHCDWVGFFDVDEFLYLPPSSNSHSLHDFLANYTTNFPSVAELRTTCYSFGPSGRKTVPPEGVTVGYTCRMITPERHKSIVRPEALSPSLVNVVHHFHLRDGYEYVNVDRAAMVINHYKYQVWEVFKEKFYRRVATYVADWQDEEKAGSKDRAPGLGTKAVEPADWSTRFCEVKDRGLRNWVIAEFADPNTGLLPWS